MTLPWTLTLLAAGAATIALCRWYEGRPREFGQVRLLPSTALMAAAVVVCVVALAHLITLLTGVPLKGSWTR